MTTLAELGVEVADLPLEQFTPHQLNEVLRWIFQSDQVPAIAKTSIRARLWLNSVERFHVEEDEALRNATYKSNLEIHRLKLNDLILQGETIVLSARRTGLLAAAPFSLESLESTLEALHIAFHCQHRPGNSEEANQRIAKLFDVPEHED